MGCKRESWESGWKLGKVGGWAKKTNRVGLWNLREGVLEDYWG